MQDILENQKLRLKFEPYKNNRFLFFITEINIRNTLIPMFASLGVKKITFMKNVEELRYEISENAWENRKNQHSICIMTYHHESIGNPAYIASLLQSIRQISKKSSAPVPFLVFADSDESLEIQFGKSPTTRALTIRAAAKNGLKGLIIGSLDDFDNANKFVEKIAEIVEDDEFAKMTPFERYLRKLINKAYGYLNKIFGSKEEKEENINKAVILFEEVLEHSKDNYEALIGKATAYSSSSEPNKIRKGCELFVKLEVIGEDAERAFEGHAGACYKMSEIAKDKPVRDQWVIKGVNSLNTLVEWQISEYKIIRKVQPDYHDPELLRQLSNKYATMASSLVEIGGEHKTTAINHYYKGIEMDPKVESNYRIVPLLEKSAKKSDDFIEIAKVCASAMENLTGKEIDFLIKEAEAYYNAGKEDEATKLFNSIYKYITKAQIEAWAKNKKDGVKPNKKDSDKIVAFITFLNHRAIHFRKIEQYEKSLDDLNTAISLDTDDSYYDIYYNLSKAILSALNDKNITVNYTQKNALSHLSTAITIALNVDLQTYENLLKAIKNDPILSPYISDIRSFLQNSQYSIPVFFK